LAIEAIKQADLILSWSWLALHQHSSEPADSGDCRRYAKSRASRVYIANLMTQPGETAGYALADHLRAIQKHVHIALSIGSSPIAAPSRPM